MSLTNKTKEWLSANCLKSLKGKTVLITGANSGIGFKEAELVLYLGGNVIMACRNLNKARSAASTLQSEYSNASISFLELDLADLSSIDRFVDAISTRNIAIDMFVQNAGVFHRPGEKTKNGFELIIGTNYFGAAYLSEKIVPYMAQQSRPSIYVNTISMIHKIATVDYKDFYYSKNYGNFRAYGRSKLSLARYTYDLAERYKDSSVRVLMNHPGMAITQMGLDAYGKHVKKLIPLAGHFFNTPEKSALSVPYILSRTPASGSIIGPNKLLGGWGYPTENRIYKKVKSGIPELLDFTWKEIAEH